MKALYRLLFESALQRKFRVARESRAIRCMIEKDSKRNAITHPTH